MVIFIKHRYYFYRRFEYDIWGLCLLDMKISNKFKNSYFFDKLSQEEELSDKILKFKQKLKKKFKFNLKKNSSLVDTFKKKQENIQWATKSWLLRFFFRLYTSALERRYERSRRYIYRIDLITHIKKRRKFNKRFLSLRIARLYFLTLKDYQFRSLFRRASKLDGNLEQNYCLLLECRIMAIFYRTNFLCNIFEIIQFVKAGYVFINFKIIKHINAPISNTSYITCSKNTISRLRSNLIKRLKFQLILFNTPRFLFISYFFFFAYLCKLPKKRDFVYPFSLDIQRITGYN